VALPHIKPWLLLEPPLAEVDLAPYFYFSRDRLSPAAPAARLPAALQELLGRLDNATTAIRRTAVDEVVALEPQDRVQLFDALIDRASRDPRSRSLDSALEVAAQSGDLVPRLAKALGEIPPTDVPHQVPAKIVAAIHPLPAELRAVIERWRDSGPQALSRRAQEALGGAR
jgi:hypothetical protein